jgi:7-cyano-7-deazaguanine synthase
MKATVVPNRNKIFSSITQAIALSIAEKKKNVDIALGYIAETIKFIQIVLIPSVMQMTMLFELGNWGADKVNYWTPYMEGNKFTILQDGEKLCEELGLILTKYINVLILLINHSSTLLKPNLDGLN